MLCHLIPVLDIGSMTLQIKYKNLTPKYIVWVADKNLVRVSKLVFPVKNLARRLCGG